MPLKSQRTDDDDDKQSLHGTLPVLFRAPVHPPPRRHELRDTPLRGPTEVVSQRALGHARDRPKREVLDGRFPAIKGGRAELVNLGDEENERHGAHGTGLREGGVVLPRADGRVVRLRCRRAVREPRVE